MIVVLVRGKCVVVGVVVVLVGIVYVAIVVIIRDICITNSMQQAE